MRYILLFFLTIVVPNATYGELQSVVLQFNPINCRGNCADLLARQFRRINGVQNVSINPQQGLVNLTYAPNAVFSFPPINTAVRVVGPNLEWIQLTVRGKVQVSGNRATIISEGDNNRFQIIAPGAPGANGMMVEYNIASHTLNPAQLDQLTQIAQRKEIVVITGPLFQPERSPPYNLIMLSVKADEQKN